MKTRILLAMLCGLAASGSALAETLVVNDQLTLREQVMRDALCGK